MYYVYDWNHDSGRSEKEKCYSKYRNVKSKNIMLSEKINRSEICSIYVKFINKQKDYTMYFKEYICAHFHTHTHTGHRHACHTHRS